MSHDSDEGRPPFSRPAGEGSVGQDRIDALWILSDGRAGHEVQTIGLAEALGLSPRIIRIAPRAFFAAVAPFGPIDPRERALLAPPFPDIVLACGRRTIPYLRHVKRASGGVVFTVYLNRPATGLGTADRIIAPRHDGFSGANVLTPLTPPNRLTPERLAAARAAPDPRIAALPNPVVGLLVGGDSRHFRFSESDIAVLAAAVSGLLAEGWSVAATLSRRTPARLAQALQAICEREREGRGRVPRAFLWDGEGENPYLSILACSDALLVTGDSVNMVSEAAATGTPVHVFAPGGGSAKIAAFLDGLEARGAIRRWAGRLEKWSYEPVTSTPELAAAIARAYLTARGRLLAIADGVG